MRGFAYRGIQKGSSGIRVDDCCVKGLRRRYPRGDHEFFVHCLQNKII